MKLASTFYRSAKDKAASAASSAKQSVGKAAQSAKEKAIGLRSSAQSQSRRAQELAKSLRHAPTRDPEAEKIEKLCDLGFSPVTARKALALCKGDVNAAASWLTDEDNADFIYATEMSAAGEASQPLSAGCIARISGLRGNAELNGLAVVLEQWDNAKQRWVAAMPDGSHKSIKACNLDRLDGVAADIAWREFRAEADRHSLAEDAEAEVLRKKLQKHLCEAQGADAEETMTALSALSFEELQEQLISLDLHEPVKERETTAYVSKDPENDRALRLAAAEQRELAGRKNRTTMSDWRRERAIAQAGGSTEIAQEESGNTQKASEKANRWICAACDEVNKASRPQCQNCGAARPESLQFDVTEELRKDGGAMPESLQLDVEEDLGKDAEVEDVPQDFTATVAIGAQDVLDPKVLNDMEARMDKLAAEWLGTVVASPSLDASSIETHLDHSREQSWAEFYNVPDALTKSPEEMLALIEDLFRAFVMSYVPPVEPEHKEDQEACKPDLTDGITTQAFTIPSSAEQVAPLGGLEKPDPAARGTVSNEEEHEISAEAVRVEPPEPQETSEPMAPQVNSEPKDSDKAAPAVSCDLAQSNASDGRSDVRIVAESEQSVNTGCATDHAIEPSELGATPQAAADLGADGGDGVLDAATIPSSAEQVASMVALEKPDPDAKREEPHQGQDEISAEALRVEPPEAKEATEPVLPQVSSDPNDSDKVAPVVSCDQAQNNATGGRSDVRIVAESEKSVNAGCATDHAIEPSEIGATMKAAADLAADVDDEVLDVDPDHMASKANGSSSASTHETPTHHASEAVDSKPVASVDTDSPPGQAASAAAPVSTGAMSEPDAKKFQPPSRAAPAPPPTRIVRQDWWGDANTRLPGLEDAPLISDIIDLRILKTVSGEPWARGRSADLYREMGMRDPSKSYFVYWLNIGDVTMVSMSEVTDCKRLEFALSGDALKARLKFILQPCSIKLPLPIKGPKDADTIGVFFGKSASISRSKTDDGIEHVVLRVDLYSKWLLKKAMQTVGFQKGSVVDLLLLDWPGRAVIVACRVDVTDNFLKLYNAHTPESNGTFKSFW